MEAVTDEIIEEEAPKNPNAETVVLVTGATSGIGKSIAEQFISNGYKVIITGRRAERLDSLKDKMEAQSAEAQIHCLPFDVCDINAVTEAMENIPEDWKNIDILINNAGLAKGFAPVQNGKVEHWDTMINTNIKGWLNVKKAM